MYRARRMFDSNSNDTHADREDLHTPSECLVLRRESTGNRFSPVKHAKLLTIGAHQFAVIYASSWPGYEEGDLGQCFSNKNVIYIHKDLPPSQAFSTLVHEIFHAVNSELDHTLLSSLAEQVSQVLWANDMLEPSLYQEDYESYTD